MDLKTSMCVVHDIPVVKDTNKDLWDAYFQPNSGPDRSSMINKCFITVYAYGFLPIWVHFLLIIIYACEK